MCKLFNRPARLHAARIAVKDQGQNNFRFCLPIREVEAPAETYSRANLFRQEPQPPRIQEVIFDQFLNR